jgi:osmotically-inducible protein OsmY
MKNNAIGANSYSYNPTDEELSEELCELLFNEPNIDASHIDLEVQDGLVNIKGSAPNLKMKQLAEKVIQSFPGVNQVINSIVINSTRTVKG